VLSRDINPAHRPTEWDRRTDGRTDGCSCPPARLQMNSSWSTAQSNCVSTADDAANFSVARASRQRPSDHQGRCTVNQAIAPLTPAHTSRPATSRKYRLTMWLSFRLRSTNTSSKRVWHLADLLCAVKVCKRFNSLNFINTIRRRYQQIYVNMPTISWNARYPTNQDSGAI